MAHYAVYHVNIHTTQQRAINIAEESAAPIEQVSPEQYHKVLDSVLFGKFTARTPQKELDCYVEKKRNGIILLILCNEKGLAIEEKKEKGEYIHHPGSYIIIDNRPGKFQIAVESNSAFNNKPDVACEILQNAINERLKEHQLEVDIRPRTIPMKFWDAVNSRRANGDSIRRVVFDFPDPSRVKNIPATEELTKQMAILHAFSASMHAAKGTLKLEAGKESALQFDQTQEDIAQMVELCCNTGYRLAVYFKKYGLYRYGKEIRQYGNLREEFVKEFISGHTMLGNTDSSELYVENWLNTLMQSSKNYTYEEVTPKKRKRSNTK
jgi:hypothetical protein